MTTFWHPIGPATTPAAYENKIKRLGSGAYALWARCDLCQYSAAFTEFVLWERGVDVGTLCTSCDSRSDIAPELLADGWRRCG